MESTVANHNISTFLHVLLQSNDSDDCFVTQICQKDRTRQCGSKV